VGRSGRTRERQGETERVNITDDVDDVDDAVFCTIVMTKIFEILET
jgi:hypothetical protein